MTEILDYNLPPAPEGHRWYIRKGTYDDAKRYLHLEKLKPQTFFKKAYYESIRNEYIVGHEVGDTFDAAVRKEAGEILNDINVNFYLPTGEAR